MLRKNSLRILKEKSVFSEERCLFTEEKEGEKKNVASLS